jgi:LysR family transcriptional regulator, benzoate and cis,cis-muconate-responsive activator of ben and cat genes
MNRNLLTLLETLESSNSISEAAHKLYLTQPYVSRTIKKYEYKYDVLLINRDSHPIQLTPAGHLLIKYLRKDLELEKQLTSEIKKYKNNNFPILKMGITPPLGQNFNLTILPKLLAKFPNLRTETLELSTVEAEKAFKDGQLDLFVGNTIYLPNIKNEFLYQDTQVLVLGKKSSLYNSNLRELKLNPNVLEQINHDNFIIVDGERRYQEIINNYFNSIGINFYPHIHVRDSVTALKLAALGLGDMTIGIEAVTTPACPNINYIKLPTDKIHINFSVSTANNERHLTTEMQYIVEILKQDFTSKILIP